MTRTHLSVRNLRKEFLLHILHGKQILGFDDISFEVPAGAFVGISGQSGSGKSSLLKCLYCTYLADSGSILFTTSPGRTIDLVTAADDEILDLRELEIGYVSQFLRPAPRVSAIELAARPLLGQGMERKVAYERVAYYFGRLALPVDLWDGYPILFSGGEQQRVNLARALAADSKLLLLDEPTSALDASLQSEVVRLLSERRDRGTTMIGVMHDAALLRELSDSLVHMENGRQVGIEPIGNRLAAEMAVAG